MNPAGCHDPQEIWENPVSFIKTISFSLMHGKKWNKKAN